MSNATQPARVVTEPTIASLAMDFDLSLASQRKSKSTRKIYGTAVKQLAAFLADRGMPTEVAKVRREHVEAFIADLLERRSPSTARTRYTGLDIFFKWCDDEGEITDSPMLKMHPPSVPEKRIPIVDEDAQRRLLKLTEGAGFAERRDHAMIRLFIASGMRRGEMAGLKLDDLDFELQLALVVGKGERPRSSPFDNDTALALRRYLRVRAKHAHAGSSSLWIGHMGALSDSAIQQLVQRRGEQAGIVGLHAHQFRHTFAHQWLADGESEGDLMRIAGWRSRAMLDRYGRSAAEGRALDAYRRRADRGQR